MFSKRCLRDRRQKGGIGGNSRARNTERKRDLSRGGGEGYSFIWPIRGRATGQVMVFGLSVLNMVYN